MHKNYFPHFVHHGRVDFNSLALGDLLRCSTFSVVFGLLKVLNVK
jgi:hypothetical protein